ncbi:uncharacterized protein LOC118425113 [Branchiostoma floridae]|uniref:Uncharacterized protein LOC118425113 n=1 Tax=Branchiostoma floridae TaxID=7739 RepID=C3ZNX1_BRAFL|nr:uncharacterized protein LOC118425113 [Branchiostoma floridae]|eukprot:XP_002589695.1 hypothetical protein BRAFLDRAFT_100822 [Branchiostoma floridae]
MAETVGQAGQAAAQPALEVLAEFGKEAAKVWGRVNIRINNPWVAAIDLGGIGAFYLANKALTMLAVRRAVERRDPDNPDQPANPEVGLEAEVDSLLVPVIFYSQLGYQYFTSILNGPFLKACLQAELATVGYEAPIDVSVEKWELPNLPEGGAGLMGMMRVQDWLAEIPEKSSLISTAAGDSGIPEDVSSIAGVSTVASWVDVEEEEEAGPSQAGIPQQPPAQDTPTAQQAELQEGPLKGWRAKLLQHKDSPTAQQAELQEDVEEEEAGTSQAKRARLPQQPPAQATPTAQQAELQKSPLKRKRARLLQHKDSPTAQQAELQEDVEEEEAGTSQAKRARLSQQPPAQAKPTAQVKPTAQQAELQEGPLKRRRAKLLQHKDSTTAWTRLRAYSCLEKGAAMVTTGGYQEGEGVEHLLEGVILMGAVTPDDVTGILYHQSWLHLDKPNLNQLTSTQLQANPDSTPCLLIQALQLPYGYSRQQAINHVIDLVLQHGETDPIYKHLAYMYRAFGHTIWQTTKQPALALSACASALMHKSDHLTTLFIIAECSRDVSVLQAIRQFHHYIHTVPDPKDHYWVPDAHYHLVTLYGQQDPSVHRDRILHHYNMAQQTDRNRLPVHGPVPSGLKDQARRVYEHVISSA